MHRVLIFIPKFRMKIYLLDGRKSHSLFRTFCGVIWWNPHHFVVAHDFEALRSKVVPIRSRKWLYLQVVGFFSWFSKFMFFEMSKVSLSLIQWCYVLIDSEMHLNKSKNKYERINVEWNWPINETQYFELKKINFTFWMAIIAMRSAYNKCITNKLCSPLLSTFCIETSSRWIANMLIYPRKTHFRTNRNPN